MTLKELRQDLHEKILKLRSIEHLISTDSFENLWNCSTEESKDTVYVAIVCDEKEMLSDWIRNHPNIDLDELSIARLRKLGQKLRIRNYSRLHKFDLIDQIKEVSKNDQNSNYT